MVRTNGIVIATVLLLFAMLLEPCQAGCYDWESSTCCATEKSNALCECNGQVRYGVGTQWSRNKPVRGLTECNTNAFGGDDPAPNKPKYCECNHIGTITCPAGYHYYRQPGWTSGPGEGTSDCAIGCPGNLALPGCAPTQAPAPASVGACRYDGRFGHCGYDCYKINNVYDCHRCSYTSADCESQRREELDPSRPRCACELSTSTTTPNVVLEWKSTTTATPGWTLDESKSDKSRVDQSIWPKFETKKDSSSTNANYDLLLFPAGTYTLVQSDGSSSSDDNNVNVWLGSQAAVDPHATHASGFVAMIMQGVAAWNGWPSFTDYHCLSPHVSTKCADSPRVDAVTFTLMEPTWLRPVYSNNYNAHDSRCQITLTFLPLSEAVPWGSYYFMAANSPGSVCPALGAFDIASSTECQQYASAHLGKAFKQVVANENEPNGCFYRKGDDDILWNTAGTAVGAGNGAGRNRLLVCKGGTLYMLLNVRSVHVCTGWYPGKASVGTMIILFELRLSSL